AWRELVPAEKLDAMTAEEYEREIERITKWSEENRAKDERALLLGALEDAVKSGKSWYRLQQQVARLAELKEKAAAPFLLRLVEAGLAVSPRDVRVWCD